MGNPGPVAECKIEFVAVGCCFIAADNGKNFKIAKSTYAFKAIYNLLLFKGKLILVAKMLPLTAAAGLKMGAKGLNALFRPFVESQYAPFEIVFLFGNNLYVGHIAGGRVFNKYYLVLNSGNAMTFGHRRAYFHLFKQAEFDFFPAHDYFFLAVI
jgi:hypothetical protein